MVDDARKAEMRQYQRRRSDARRRHGLVTRTSWIRKEDAAAFQDAVAPFVDHARIIEALIGTAPLPQLDLLALIERHGFSYDPEDIVFLLNARTSIALRPLERDAIERTACEILDRYGLPISLDDVLN